MTDTRPIVKCQEKGCPVIGRFSTGYCPLHADRASARRPTLIESWEAGDDH